MGITIGMFNQIKSIFNIYLTANQVSGLGYHNNLN